MDVAAVAAVVAAADVANLGGHAPTAQNTRCVCGKKQLWKTFPPPFVFGPLFSHVQVRPELVQQQYRPKKDFFP